MLFILSDLTAVSLPPSMFPFSLFMSFEAISSLPSLWIFPSRLSILSELMFASSCDMIFPFLLSMFLEAASILPALNATPSLLLKSSAFIEAFPPLNMFPLSLTSLSAVISISAVPFTIPEKLSILLPTSFTSPFA